MTNGIGSSGSSWFTHVIGSHSRRLMLMLLITRLFRLDCLLNAVETRWHVFIEPDLTIPLFASSPKHGFLKTNSNPNHYRWNRKEIAHPTCWRHSISGIIYFLLLCLFKYTSCIFTVELSKANTLKFGVLATMPHMKNKNPTKKTTVLRISLSIRFHAIRFSCKCTLRSLTSVT